MLCYSRVKFHTEALELRLGGSGHFVLVILITLVRTMSKFELGINFQFDFGLGMVELGSMSDQMRHVTY